MKKVKKALIYITIFLYIYSFLVVIFTKYINGYENFLYTNTKENGFFEIVGAIALILMAFLGFFYVFINHKNMKKLINFIICLFSVICFLAFMEEISWTQHIFHFKSGDFFQTHNFQNETNLHNLIPASIFSSIIYFIVYGFYIFIPLFIRLQKNIFFKKLLPYIPSLHVSLIIIFASSFQAYFYDDFGATFDTITLFVSILMFLLVVKLTNMLRKDIILHFLSIIFCIICFLLSHEIFNFFNAQYEIRETFVVLATFIYFLNLLLILQKKF